MSDDRELLEKAAKAAGLTVEFHETFSADLRSKQLLAYIRDDGPRNLRLTDLKLWSPLTDDGDALRLACKLELQIIVVGEGMCEVKCPDRHLAPVWEHVSGNDTALAVRRAIVRAAATLALQEAQ